MMVTHNIKPVHPSSTICPICGKKVSLRVISKYFWHSTCYYTEPFLRRIKYPLGRLTEDNPYCISKIPILLEKAGWGFFNLILLFKANV